MHRAIPHSVIAGLLLMAACDSTTPDATTATTATSATSATPDAVTAGLARYTTVPLVADTTALTPAERRMLPLLIAAANEMNDIYWDQAYGNRDSLLGAVSDSATRLLAEINYGPWDRLDEDRPFIAGVGPKPAGANLYPHDVTKAEFDAAVAAGPAA
ncbi:MAG: dipeptidyl-peptidase 3 family protein, partial [Gemmatimonadaceae bacterium]